VATQSQLAFAMALHRGDAFHHYVEYLALGHRRKSTLTFPERVSRIVVRATRVPGAGCPRFALLLG
jgi:hypothetical protein